jgi:nucleoside-diphosphate-sugar epimerase
VRILIIGGTRFIGPRVVSHLIGMGHEVTLFHRGRTMLDASIAVDEILGDRCHLPDFAEVLGRPTLDVVLDMIPITEPQARLVMQTFRGLARRVVAISSQDVYREYGLLTGTERGDEATAPPDHATALTEDAPLRRTLYPHRDQAQGPDDLMYNYEKILIERVVMGDPELPGTVLRLPMVYGPGDPQHRLFEHLKRMDDGRPAILMDEDLAAWRWTRGYVDDVAAAIAIAVTQDRAAGRIYNAGESDALPMAGWVEAIGRAAGWGGRVAVVPRDALPAALASPADMRHHLIADTHRLRGELGFAESLPREEALARTIAWEREHPPARVDPSQFDYAAEDAVLAARAPGATRVHHASGRAPRARDPETRA